MNLKKEKKKKQRKKEKRHNWTLKVTKGIPKVKSHNSPHNFLKSIHLFLIANTQHLVCGRHCSKHFTYLSSCTPHNQPNWASFIVPILQMMYSEVAWPVQVTWRRSNRTALLQQLGLCWSLAIFVNFIQGKESIFMSCLFLVPGPDASVTGYPHKNGGPQHTYLWMHQGTFLQGELGILWTMLMGHFWC